MSKDSKNKRSSKTIDGDIIIDKNINTRKSFKDHFSKDNLKFVIEIIAAIATAIAAIVGLLTINEMRIDRNSAYKPSILINPTQYEYSWDEKGNVKGLPGDAKDLSSDSTVEYISGETIRSTITIPVSIIEEGFQQFSIVNAGVGTAKYVSFEWYNDNLRNLNDYLIECNPERKDFFMYNESAVFDYDGRLIVTDLPESTEIMYMVPESGETYNIPLPTTYYLVLLEIIKEAKVLDEIPYLILSANYCDIHGKSYTDTFLIHIKVIKREIGQSGEGNAVFQLVPLFEIE